MVLSNENSDLVAQNRKYVMRITGDDAEGKAQLDNFILPESQYPELEAKLTQSQTDSEKLMDAAVRQLLVV